MLVHCGFNEKQRQNPNHSPDLNLNQVSHQHQQQISNPQQYHSSNNTISSVSAWKNDNLRKGVRVSRDFPRETLSPFVVVTPSSSTSITGETGEILNSGGQFDRVNNNSYGSAAEINDLGKNQNVATGTTGNLQLHLYNSSRNNNNNNKNSRNTSDAYLSSVKMESLNLKQNANNNRNNSNSNLAIRPPTSAPNTPNFGLDSMRKGQGQIGQGQINYRTRMESPTLMKIPAKKDKMEYNTQMMIKMQSNAVDRTPTRPLSYHEKLTEIGGLKRHTSLNSPSSGIIPGGVRNKKDSNLINRRSMPGPYSENRFREKFDISDLDTNLPRIDLEEIENHLRLAKEEERKRRSDREEIRKRLALESEDFNDKFQYGRKPSLHSRLQSSMNLQICFMNETATSDDSESPNSDSESKIQPSSLPPCANKAQTGFGKGVEEEVVGQNESVKNKEDLQALQIKLQSEARQALSQAKDLARLQIVQEKEQRICSPITDMVRNSLKKVGVVLPQERRRVTRQLLTEMNVNMLQVIVNDLHTHIEMLNETLVSMLLERDDLHMEQDSMLVDIEDLTRYLAAKDNSHASLPLISSRSLLGKK